MANEIATQVDQIIRDLHEAPPHLRNTPPRVIQRKINTLLKIINREQTRLHRELVAHHSGLDDSQAMELYLVAHRSMNASRCLQRCIETWPGAPPEAMGYAEDVATQLEQDPHNRTLQAEMVKAVGELQSQAPQSCNVECGGELADIPEYREVMARWSERRDQLHGDLARLGEAETHLRAIVKHG